VPIEPSSMRALDGALDPKTHAKTKAGATGICLATGTPPRVRCSMSAPPAWRLLGVRHRSSQAQTPMDRR
jgi:hypothetical protein